MNGMKFSAKCNYNDRCGHSCAIHYKGTWWFNCCMLFPLNEGPVNSNIGVL